MNKTAGASYVFFHFPQGSFHRWPASGSSLERRDNTPHSPAIRYLGGPNRVSIGKLKIKGMNFRFEVYVCLFGKKVRAGTLNLE